MDKYIIYILLIFISVCIITGIVVYFLIQNQSKIIYINQFENSSISQSSRLLLKKPHLDKTLILEGGKYNILFGR